jgi:hypothetical protein
VTLNQRSLRVSRHRNIFLGVNLRSMQTIQYLDLPVKFRKFQMCISMCNPSKVDSMALCNNILWWSFAPAGVLLSTHMMLDIVCNSHNPYISWYQCRVSKYAISLVLTEVWAHRYLFQFTQTLIRFPCLLLTKAWTFLHTQSNLWKSSSQPFLPSDSCFMQNLYNCKSSQIRQ